MRIRIACKRSSRPSTYSAIWPAAFEDARIVPLGQRLSLLPMTDALFDAVTVAGTPQLDGFWKGWPIMGRV